MNGALLEPITPSSTCFGAHVRTRFLAAALLAILLLGAAATTLMATSAGR